MSPKFNFHHTAIWNYKIKVEIVGLTYTRNNIISPQNRYLHSKEMPPY